jgi:PST family polysaccharide transporter
MIIAGASAIVIAYAGYGVYVLVWQILIHTSMRVIVMWIVTAWTPKLIFDSKAIKDLMEFSLNLFGLQIFNYWVRNADNLLIGKFIGSSGLGIYSRAYSLMLMPVVQINQVLGRVIFPAFSKIQKDKRRIKSIYLRAIYSIGIVSFPIILGLVVVSKEFILVLFGPKWEAAIPVLQVLCLVGLFQSIANTTGWIYNSQGKTRLHFKWGIFGGILTFIAFGIGINWGVMGVAVAYLIRVYAISYFHLAITAKLINLTVKEIIQRLSGVFFAALLMAALVWGLGLVLPIYWSLWLQLAFKVFSGATFYIILLCISGQWARIKRELIFFS